MFFEADANLVRVAAVTNQSTGYCPEPESWPAVAAALDSLGMSHPGRFTTEFVFRRCGKCGQRNIVKDQLFESGTCDSPLSANWNFNPPDST